jgi:hypothetical protein
LLEKFAIIATKYEPIIDLLTSMIPIVLAILGSYIAIQQRRNARRKLKLDLFDKRFPVFQSTKNYLGHVLTGSYKDKALQQEFLVKTRGAGFVFDQKIKAYIDEVWEKSVELDGWSQDQNTSEHSGQRAAHLKWFTSELSKIEERFRKYMQLSQ